MVRPCTQCEKHKVESTHKHKYKIDGTLLKFFVNYLEGRKQQVIIDNAVSNSVDVLSGVPQGSILGPLLFVLFMNGIYESIDAETNIELYADDTKIWREIKSESDCDFLQKDIDALYAYSGKNKKSFHPDKCKVVSIYDFRPEFIKILPFPKKPYMIGNFDIDYSVCEKDLGVLVNEKFRWEDHHSKILNNAHQMLGFTKRTCHFISDIRKRRSLYLSLVRSNFEHASIIWHPTTETAINEFEQLQKKALKWILNEKNLHYDDEAYVKKCYQTHLSPMKVFFDINDLTYFHMIINNQILLILPEYIKPYTGQSRLRQTNLDDMSFVCTYNSSSFPSSISPFYKSFFYRVVYTWNSIPLSIRNIPNIQSFKHNVISHFFTLYDPGPSMILF